MLYFSWGFHISSLKILKQQVKKAKFYKIWMMKTLWKKVSFWKNLLKTPSEKSNRGQTLPKWASFNNLPNKSFSLEAS